MTKLAVLHRIIELASGIPDSKDHAICWLRIIESLAVHLYDEISDEDAEKLAADPPREYTAVGN